MSLRIGVIGYGYWGPNLVRNFFTCPHTTVAPVCDQSAERLQKFTALHPSVPTTDDVERGLVFMAYNQSLGWFVDACRRGDAEIVVHFRCCAGFAFGHFKVNEAAVEILLKQIKASHLVTVGGEAGHFCGEQSVCDSRFFGTSRANDRQMRLIGHA